jgi:hypothetical protein
MGRQIPGRMLISIAGTDRGGAEKAPRSPFRSFVRAETGSAMAGIAENC